MPCCCVERNLLGTSARPACTCSSEQLISPLGDSGAAMVITPSKATKLRRLTVLHISPCSVIAASMTRFHARHESAFEFRNNRF